MEIQPGNKLALSERLLGRVLNVTFENSTEVGDTSRYGDQYFMSLVGVRALETARRATSFPVTVKMREHDTIAVAEELALALSLKEVQSDPELKARIEILRDIFKATTNEAMAEPEGPAVLEDHEPQTAQSETAEAPL